ncbi:Uncharacterised protein [Vibrio cholerae]|nr:Uncharacterised protein [Vibrio cholerae]
MFILRLRCWEVCFVAVSLSKAQSWIYSDLAT